MTRRIDISYKTIIFITVFIILLWALYLIRDIILLVFVAFILMSAVAPLVEQLRRLKIPKAVAISIIFLLIISMLAGLITVGLTPLISQTSSLTQKLAETVGFLFRANVIDQNVIQEQLSNLSSNLINFTLNLFEGFIAFVSVIVITFYMLLDREQIEKRAALLFVNQQERATKLITVIEYKLGAWLRGQLILSLIVGVLVYLGLTVLGVGFALPLAIFAAFLEVVPVIGPIISAIPAILIALTISPLLAGLVTGMYIAVQQLEGHVIVPQVMKRAVGLNPLLVILAISIGGRLLGIAGALLAVPIAVVIQVVLQEILHPKQAQLI